MTPPEPARRMVELDALRGIAAVMVVLFHFTWRSEGVLPAAHGPAWGFAWGYYGVALFFAISGFVILMTLARTTSATDFLVNRIARLYPAYWAAVLATTVGVILLGAPELAQPGGVVAANLTMLQSYLMVPAVDGAYWSLAVELGFYACMLALWRMHLLGRIERVVIGWVALKLAWWLVPALPWRVGAVLVLRDLPWFALGMIAFRVMTGARRWRDQVPVLVVVTIGIAVAHPARDLIVFALVLALFGALTRGYLGFLNRPLLLWLGAVSYPLYLMHQNLGYALIAAIERAGGSPWLAISSAILAALALAHLVRARIEQPALRLIRGWWKARRSFRPAPAADPA